MKKLLAIGIILLFIGVAVAPSINSSVVKASNDNDLVEVTSQACGIQGFGNTTVKLTKQQYQNLEQYLVEFRARLNQTTTREEAIPIFKDAVVELNKYRLLPKGMSVEKAQKLITRNEKSEYVLKRKSTSLNTSGFSNLLCLIVGRATICCLSGIITTGIQLIILYLLHFVYTYQALILFLFMQIPFIWLWTLRNDTPLLSVILSFFSVLSLLTFGVTNRLLVPPPTLAADGWIYTAGLMGIKNYTGSFFGRINYPVVNILGTLCTGAFGFTGFKINFPNQSSLFLGVALLVNISDSLSK